MAAASNSSGAEGATASESKGFYVTPKTDCQHVKDVVDGDQKIGVDINEKCNDCREKGENWLCLSCGVVFCSRYVNGHMVKHNEMSGHPITISYADISIWCYACDSYIESPLLRGVLQTVAKEKFK